MNCCPLLHGTGLQTGGFQHAKILGLVGKFGHLYKLGRQLDPNSNYKAYFSHMALKTSLPSELSFLCEVKQSINCSPSHPHRSPAEQGYQGAPAAALQQAASCPASAGLKMNRWLSKITFSCVSYQTYACIVYIAADVLGSFNQRITLTEMGTQTCINMCL